MTLDETTRQHDNEHEGPDIPTVLVKIREALTEIDYSLAEWAQEQRAAAQRFSIELRRKEHSATTDSPSAGVSLPTTEGE